MITKKKHIRIPGYIAIGLLILALNPFNPYGYYILLRWVCCAIFIYFAFIAFENNKVAWVWILGIMAFIYNPIIRFHLNRPLWAIINIVSIVAIFKSFSNLTSQLRGQNDSEN